MPDYTWPPPEKRKYIGKRISRVDGPAKATGRARYTYDYNPKGLLYGVILRCPHAHAKVVSVDTSAAANMPGVKAIEILQGPGREIFWAGDEVVAVAAVDENTARDAMRKIKVEYERLPHLVLDATEPSKRLPENASFYKAPATANQGDTEKAFREAAAVSEGLYGSPVITHCCLEPHGAVSEWTDDEHLFIHVSTQAVSSIAADAAKLMKISASNVHVHQDHVGGGFGSKFSLDRWGVATALLSKKAGGKPVKIMLTRAEELEVAGCRPSAYARVKVAADKDGKITGWEHAGWGTGGQGGGGSPPIPYLMTESIPNYKTQWTTVAANIGSARAWRAPNHPQAAVITLCALDDLAAKLNLDPVKFLLKNIDLTGERAKIYRDEFPIADKLMGWSQRWHPRGDKTTGPIKRGLGVSIHTWGGRGHASSCDIAIHPDGSVEVKMGTQDLGTGTRTCILAVVADTLGVPFSNINLLIGDNQYPPSGGSGGSSTIGGVSASSRRGAVDARDALFAKVAPALNAKPEELEAVDGFVRVASAPTRKLSWKEACAKLGPTAITARGENKGGMKPDLTNANVGGVQMADVSVDVETGIVKINKMVAVQDCGLVIDLKTAESQTLGALIMGISYSLYEEKVMDPTTGLMLNPDMEFYRLAGIADVGELVVHMMQGPGYDERGVIGLGEPPTVSPGAAISNAVANAIGVRVPFIPLTPPRVLAALEHKEGGRA